MKWPRISVITPSFNQAKFIERTILSVLSQDYPNLEYIVMDGGSTDGTLEILKKYSKKINFFSKKDMGQADAINKGLKIATGEILAYLNSDDVYEKGALKKLASFFKNNPKTLWVVGKAKIIDDKDKEVRRFITLYRNFWLKRLSPKLLLIINPIPQPSTFWRRKVLEEVGFFNQKEYYVMDYDYWLRVIKKFRPGIINGYLASFRIHKKSKGEINFVQHFKDEFEMARQYTKNPIFIFLHYLNYLTIISGYSLLRIFKK